MYCIHKTFGTYPDHLIGGHFVAHFHAEAETEGDKKEDFDCRVSRLRHCFRKRLRWQTFLIWAKRFSDVTMASLNSLIQVAYLQSRYAQNFHRSHTSFGNVSHNSQASCNTTVTSTTVTTTTTTKVRFQLHIISIMQTRTIKLDYHDSPVTTTTTIDHPGSDSSHTIR